MTQRELRAAAAIDEVEEAREELSRAFDYLNAARGTRYEADAQGAVVRAEGRYDAALDELVAASDETITL